MLSPNYLPAAEDRESASIPRLARNLLATAAVVEIAAAIVLLVVSPTENLPAHSPGITLLLQILAFGVTGGLLYFLGKDEAARLLGLMYLLMGSAFAYVPVTNAPYLAWLKTFPLDAFLPWITWNFACTFPTGEFTPKLRKFLSALSWGLLLVACVLVLCNVLPDAIDPAGLFKRSPTSYYSYVVYLSAIAALGGIYVKFSQASNEEQNRAKLLVLALGLAAVVFLLYLLIALVPALSDYLQHGDGRVVAVPLIHATILSIPITTAYAIAMGESVRLRVLFTLFVRYRAARIASWLFVLVPLAAFAGLLWGSREQSLEQVASSIYGVMLFFFGVIGLVAYGFRGKISGRIERTFFREAYDPSSSTVSLGNLLHEASTPSELAQVIANELDAAIHLPHSSIVVKQENAWADIEQSIESLPIDSTLIWNLNDRPQTPEELIEAPDDITQNWLTESRASLLTPINTASGKLVGAIVSGSKKSGLEYTGQDKDLLTTTARLVLPHLQRVLGPEFSADTNDELPRCAMCVSCNLVQPRYSSSCPDCSGAMLTLAVPKLVNRKYDIERCLGHGASGLALLARDQRLDRHVVLKTLPSVQPQAIKALQSEARAMAALDHPAIATIHELEIWRGLPILVMEHLEGGTLADQLSSGPLSVSEVVDVAETMLDACQYLHGKGLIHADIKPSNMGYDARASIKLFDFGLARNVHDVVDSCLSGTPLYLSPELLAGAPFNERSDLWALSISLYELASGDNPVPKDSLASALKFLRSVEIPCLSSTSPETLGTLDQFFARTLSENLAERPATADQTIDLLRQCRP